MDLKEIGSKSGVSWLRIGTSDPLTGFCELDNELSGSIKSAKFMTS
jgi:hypothetical protein